MQLAAPSTSRQSSEKPFPVWAALPVGGAPGDTSPLWAELQEKQTYPSGQLLPFLLLGSQVLSVHLQLVLQELMFPAHGPVRTDHVPHRITASCHKLLLSFQ